MSPVLFETRGVTGYVEGPGGLRWVLDDVSIRVRRGRTFALLGESGSGKTFLVHSVLGLHEARPGVVKGTARVLDVDVFAGLPDAVSYEPGPPLRIRKNLAAWDAALGARLANLLGRRITLVPQDPGTSLPPFYTVGALLERALSRGSRSRTRSERRAAAVDWLERVQMYGAHQVASLYPHELSGGMAQRVALALALAPAPDLVVADEPTTGLDATLRVRVIQILREVVSCLGLTLILITHDTEAARLVADDVAVLCAGRVVEEGPADRVLDPSVVPKHPYTRMLLEAEDWLATGRRRAAPPVSSGARDLTAGCGFRGRCPRGEGGSPCGVPALEQVAPDHRIACGRRLS